MVHDVFSFSRFNWNLYPIFLEVISSEKISVGPPFYHKLIIPFLIPFLIIMTIGPKLRWIKSNLDQKIFLFLLLIISLFLSFFVVKNLKVDFLIYTILIGSAFYLFFMTLRDFFRLKLVNFSQNIAHFGFSLFILSILFNNIFTNEIITNLKVGETFQSDKVKIHFENIEQENKQNYNSLTGKFNIENLKGITEILKPELRIYNQPNIVTSEADIKTSLFEDKFITINIVQNKEYFNVRYQTKPFMIWFLFCFVD